jgi:hypothetical protein
MTTQRQRFHYTRLCEECHRKRLCSYTSFGCAKRTWLCYDCDRQYEQALADAVKVALRRLHYGAQAVQRH